MREPFRREVSGGDTDDRDADEVEETSADESDSPDIGDPTVTVGDDAESADDSGGSAADSLASAVGRVRDAGETVVDQGSDAVGLAVESASGALENDFDGPRSRVARTQVGPEESQLRAEAAEQTTFSEDDIVVREGDGRLEAQVTDEAVEERVRGNVLDDIETGFLGSGDADPDRVQVERTEDGVDVEVDRESGISGVEAIVQGEQTSRDFLVAEDERFRESLADPAGDIVRGDDSTAREFGGAAVEEGVGSFSPAGAAVFANDAASTFADVTKRGPGTTIAFDLDDQQRDTLDNAGDDIVEGIEDPSAGQAGRAAGAAAAFALPFAAPRAARGAGNRLSGARSRLPDVDELGQFRGDTSARLNTRQRRSRDGEQKTITRDDPAADPSDPTPSEAIDDITTRIGGEGTMSRPSRGLDDDIVVEPRQSGRTQRSPEDQLPPREEFPSDAAYQRELDQLRARRADDASTTTTQDASTAGASPNGASAAETTGLVGRSSRSQIGAAAAAAATPAEDIAADAEAAVDSGLDIGVGSVADADADVDAGVDPDISVGAGIDVDTIPGLDEGTVATTTTATTQAVDQTSTQQQTQQQTQAQTLLQDQDQSRPGRPRLPELGGVNGDRDDSFGIDIDSLGVERDLGDPDFLGGE